MKNAIKELSRILGRQRQKKAPVLGARELEVMKVVWRGQALSAQQILQSSIDDSISLSTVQSTLERLHRKGLIAREKAGRFYIYSAKVSRSDFIHQLLGTIAEQISDGEMAPMISGFMSFIDEESPESMPTQLRDVIQQLPFDSDE